MIKSSTFSPQLASGVLTPVPPRVSLSNASKRWATLQIQTKRFRVCVANLSFAISVSSIFVLALLSVLMLPSAALAQWPVEAEQQIGVGFGQSYVCELGETHTHSGIDCLCGAGQALYAPDNGTITFVGSVPAGEQAGSGTTTAISIHRADGSVVTVMPVQSSAVHQGDVVASGQYLGVVAATGDRSSASTHVHISLRRNGIYVDPSELLGLQPVIQQQEAQQLAPVFVQAPNFSEAQAQEAYGQQAMVQPIGQAVVQTQTQDASQLAQDPVITSSIAGQVPAISASASSASELELGPLSSVAHWFSQGWNQTIYNMQAMLDSAGLSVLPAWTLLLFAIALIAIPTLICMRKKLRSNINSVISRWKGERLNLQKST